VLPVLAGEKKDEVNAAGNKIGADELPAVTQLFTEDYMVDFLLDNTLGAWHAGKSSPRIPSWPKPPRAKTNSARPSRCRAARGNICASSKARTASGRPPPAPSTAGPKRRQALKCLDPCMGSGHFVVAMFERLVALRLAEEKLDEAAAVAAVIRDNLFGLEIDPRCTQIGAFNLALAAWRRVGHCKLPAMNLACSGLAPNTKRSRLAGDCRRQPGSSAAWSGSTAVPGRAGAGQPHQPARRRGRFAGGRVP
jgi:hypothetical protein